MDICGEHGDDIAYSGRDCPACSEIEQLNIDHKEEIASLIYDHNGEIDDMQDTIDELQDKLEKE